MGRAFTSADSQPEIRPPALRRPGLSACCALLALILALSACADSAGPRLVQRHKRRTDAQKSGGAQFRESEEPGERGLGIEDEAQTEEALQSFGEAQVLEGAGEIDDLESIVEGGSVDPVAMIAAERRARAESKRQAELAEVARLQAEIEKRRKEEAEAELQAKQERARREADRSERSEQAAREREQTEVALSELGGEGEGEDLTSLKRRIDARLAFLGRYREGSAASKSATIPTTIHTLADLYVRYANERFLHDMSRFDRNEQLCEQGKAGCDPDMGLPLKDFTEAIELYEELLEEYPNRRDNDKVLYQLSFAYQEMGMIDRSEEVLISFLEKNKGDPRSQAAWFRLGMSYVNRSAGLDIFSAMDWLEKAQDSFKNAIAIKTDDPYYHYQALFQLGWSSFRMARYEDTVDWMDTLVRLVIENEKKAGRYERFADVYEQSTGLVREAIRFEAIAWSEMGDGRSGPTNLESFWKNSPKSDYEQYTYISMGAFYEKEERYQEAIEIYRRMVEKYPTYSAVPRVMELIVTVYEKDKRWDKVNGAREDIVERLAPGGTWWEANTGEKDREDSQKIRSKAVFQLAQYHLAKAQAKGTKNPAEHYQMAADNYRLFLKDYPQDKEAPEARFFLAESYYSLEDWPNAAIEYEKVAWQSEHTGKRRQSAAYKAIVAWQNALDKDLDQFKAEFESAAAQPAQSPDEGADEEAPKEFDRGEGLKKSRFTSPLIAALARFVEAYPDHPETADMLFNQGELLFTSKQYARAREVYRGVIDRFPKDPRSAQAQEFIAITFLEGGDQVAAEQEFRRALALLPAGRQYDAKRKDLRTLIAAAIYKQAEQARKDKQFLAAAELFLSVPNDPELQDVDIAPNAYYDGAIAYKDAGRWDSAILTFNGLADDYPDSELAPKGMAVVGTHYRDEDQLPQAAESFLKASALFERQEDMERAEELYYVSGKMYEELEDWERTLQTFRDYTRKFGAKPKRLVEAKFIEGFAAYSREQYDQAGKIWDQLFAMQTRYEKENPDLPKNFAARAKFLLAELAYDEYAPFELKLPLDKSLKRKQQLLTRMIKLYGEAAAFQVEEFTTASTYKIGEGLLNFRTALLNSERPEEIMGDELLMEEYGFALEEQAFPFEEKAIQTFEQNVTYSRKHETFNDWIGKSYRKLATIVPGRYAKTELGDALVCGELDFQVGNPKRKPPVPKKKLKKPAQPAATQGKPAPQGKPGTETAPQDTPQGNAAPAGQPAKPAARPGNQPQGAKK